MTANPFIRLYETPVEALTAAAFALVLFASLLLSIWALAWLILELKSGWKRNWRAIPPLKYFGKTAAAILILAIDLLLLAAIIHVLTP